MVLLHIKIGGAGRTPALPELFSSMLEREEIKENKGKLVFIKIERRAGLRLREPALPELFSSNSEGEDKRKLLLLFCLFVIILSFFLLFVKAFYLF